MEGGWETHRTFSPEVKFKVKFLEGAKGGRRLAVPPDAEKRKRWEGAQRGTEGC